MLIRKDTRRINFPMLAKVMGWLLMIESSFMCVPFIVSLCYCESDWVPFCITALATFLVGFFLNLSIKPARSGMGKREGFLLTAMVWLIFSLFGMVPFLICSTPLNVEDAFFEAMAGFTTTGCSAFSDIDALSHGINIWRALMQWIGGVGIIIFTVAVIPMLNDSGGLQMFNAEVTGIMHEKIRPRINQTAKTIWGVYALLTLACALLLWAGPMSLFDSVCHAFGTLSTGGFSTHAASLHYWDSGYVDSVVIIFMFLGGTNFGLIYFASKRNFKPLKQNGTFRAYIKLIVCLTIVYIIIILAKGVEHNLIDTILFPLFQVVATITSTGYIAPTLNLWGYFAFAMLIPIMFIGGCAGSTSGGAKIDRLVVLVKYLRNELLKALQPNRVTSVKIDEKVLSPEVVSKAVSFLCLYGILILVGTLALTILNVPVMDSFFSSISCATNLGVGSDAVGLGSGILAMPMGAKWILSFMMMIGRLEIFTILILFIPAFWHR